MSEDVQAVLDFLPCRTPDEWLAQAVDNLPTLLIDHANCEKKAAGTALSLLTKYVDRPDLLMRLAKLAREELRHFEQVVQILNARNIEYTHVSASRYAGRLRQLVGKSEPQRLVDTLLTGAIIEARSCERFLRLIEVLPDDLATFYEQLLASEARHFEHYLELAEKYADGPVARRLETMLSVEADLIRSNDSALRFHSGPVGVSDAETL